MSRKWHILFCDEMEKACPVTEFINECSPRHQVKVLRLLSLLEEQGPILQGPMQMSCMTVYMNSDSRCPEQRSGSFIFFAIRNLSYSIPCFLKIPRRFRKSISKSL